MDAIVIKSYLQLPGRRPGSPDVALARHGDFFIAADAADVLRPIIGQFDRLRIAGYISIVFNGVVVADARLCGYVDQMWGYLLNLITEFLQSGVATTYMPDQPVVWKLANAGPDFVRLYVDEEVVVAPRRDLLCALANGASSFFEAMLSYWDQQSFRLALEDSAKLRQQLGCLK